MKPTVILTAIRNLQASRAPASAGSIHARIAALLAVLTVPAIAAPGEFGALAGSAPAESEQTARNLAAVSPMPFEQAGKSFPGSAFFYLADPPERSLVALPAAGSLDTDAQGGQQLGALIDAGPPARPFFSASTGMARDRALECLAQAVWYEAASESEAGQRAVAQVVLNRVAHPAWPGSVCGVVYQGSQRRTGCQFTFACDGSLRRAASGSSWRRAREVAAHALSGSVYSAIGHATHYHTLWVDPKWASSLDVIGTIGAHRFYRNRGSGGEKAAFTARYRGAEPSVRGQIAAPAAPEPAPLTSNTPSAIPGTENKADPVAAAPVTAKPQYGSVGEVKQEYARAGQWKAAEPRRAKGATSATAEKPE